jgi:hypothetical protein
MQLDFLIRESEKNYREKAKEFLTSHQLADFRKSPALFWKKKQGLIPDEDRPAYALGRAVHVMVLEGGEEFDRRYVVGGPINPRTQKRFGINTKAYMDWAITQNKPVLAEEQFELIAQMRASVLAHEIARELLASGVAENVVRAEYCNIPCQIRMDWFNPKQGFVDLKTCDDLTWFEADARRFQYLHQLAFYQAVLALKAGTEMPVHLLAVEKKEPFRCGVWRVAEEVLAHARQENEEALNRFKQCLAENIWPSGYEELRIFDSI